MDEGWITADEMHAALDTAGSRATRHQIERWRREGLLPRPRQIGHGRGKGSHAVMPLTSVAQAQEIARLYALREKRDWVGWQLWLRGFAVDERYWREPLENARDAMFEARHTAAKFERLLNRNDSDADAIKNVALEIVRGTVLYAPFAKLPAQLVGTLIGFAGEIVRGQFSGFSLEGEAKPNRAELDAVVKTIGADSAERHSVAGNSINFKGGIEAILRDVAKAFSRLTRRNSYIEPIIEARREFLVGSEIGISLYRALSPGFGRNALGLGSFNRIAANPTIELQAIMLLGWAEYRKISNDLLPFSEIAKLHKQAADLAQKSRNDPEI